MTNARHNFIYAKVKNCNFDLFELCLFSVAKAFIVFAFKTCKWHSQCSPELARSRRQDFDHKTQNIADKSRRRTSLWKEAAWPRKTRELTASWLLRCGLHAMLHLAKKAVWWKIPAEPTRGGNLGSQDASTSHVSHVDHSVIPSAKSFLVINFTIVVSIEHEMKLKGPELQSRRQLFRSHGGLDIFLKGMILYLKCTQ